jgi:microcystin-dependent protein
MDPFIAEIRILPYDFPPKDWARCDGQLMAISQYTALYSIIGTWYGGDGKQSFALPDLVDSVPIGQGDDGQGNSYNVGDSGGAAAVALTNQTMYKHTHRVQVSSRGATERQPVNQLFAVGTGVAMYDTKDKPPTSMDRHMIQVTGGDQPHNNLMPYIAAPYCIALAGVFPNRS